MGALCRYLKRAHGYQIDIDECYRLLGGNPHPTSRNIMCIKSAWAGEKVCKVRIINVKNNVLFSICACLVAISVISLILVN